MSETKKCPFCGEEILAVAVKCKHCSSDLSQIIAAKAAEGLLQELTAVIEQTIRDNRPPRTKTLYFSPDIPPDKLEAAKSKFASKMSAEERVLMLGEKKALGFHLCGFILTDKNFYYSGVNDYSNGLAGSRKGVVPFHQIRTLVFHEKGFTSEAHFVLNGMGPYESDLIPNRPLKNALF